MNTARDSYVKSVTRGNQILSGNIQPGQVVSADKKEFYSDDIEYDEVDDYKNDPDYVPETEDSETEEEDSEVEGSDVEVEGSDVEGSEVEGSDVEVEGSDVEVEGSDVEVEGSEVEMEEEDNYKKDPDYVPESESDSDETSDTDYDYDYDYENEKVFGCDGCDYEWKDGWKQGWKSAMKCIEEQTKLNRTAPEAPTCDNCGIACKLKKCGGTCNGLVKYCNEQCQLIHWRKTHKFACLKK
jgi:hypothetical protein